MKINKHPTETDNFWWSRQEGKAVDSHLHQDAKSGREGKGPMLRLIRFSLSQCNGLNNVVSLSDGAAQRYTRAIKSAACARGDLQVTSVSHSVNAAVSVQWELLNKTSSSTAVRKTRIHVRASRTKSLLLRRENRNASRLERVRKTEDPVVR